MFTDACVNRDGHWVYHARKGCAHVRTEDEDGPIMPVGWTAQHLTQVRSDQGDHHE